MLAQPTGPGSEFYRKLGIITLNRTAAQCMAIPLTPPLKWFGCADTVSWASAQAPKIPERIQ